MTIDSIITAAKKIATGSDLSELENMGYASDYAERGYHTEKGVFFANWNGPLMSRVGELLEKAGYDTEWSDEWYTCECGRAVRTSPDSYGWVQDYWLGDGFLVCGECVREDPCDYLDWLVETEGALSVWGIDPVDHGFTKVQGGYESGFHPGQDADPKKILADVKKWWAGEYFFKIDGSGQFDVEFSLWRKT